MQAPRRTPPFSLRLANRVAYRLVFRNIVACSDWIAAAWHHRCGADRADLIRWYLALGIDMREPMARPESCGAGTDDACGWIKLGSSAKRCLGAGLRSRSWAKS